MRGLSVSRKLGVMGCSALAAIALAACSSSSPSSGSGGANVGAATTAASVSTPSSQAPANSLPPTTQATPSTAQAAAIAPDPCAMVTAAEAGTLTGATFAAGKAEAWGSGGKGCTYSSPTLQIVSVQTARAQTAAEAQAAWAKEQAQIPTFLEQAAQAPASAHLTTNVTPLSGYGDQAALISGSGTLQGVTLTVSGIYLLKGATFVGFEALAIGHPAPSAAAIEAQATTTLGRMG